ncbi:hypothetical protein [Roseibium sediminis]|uniref:hypothetical protein n=1 Tax=Roseibium sediminis TaxID=1775174 RepID=UPI00123D8EB5|nr:hypothetical protein [Roseibium sediminis]
MEPGHNTRANDAVLAFRLTSLQKAQEDKASQDGKYSSAIAKLSAKGFNTDAAKEALKIHKAGNAAEKVAYLQDLANFLRILGTPLESDQPDLFAKQSNKMTPEERAREDGFGAGILGLGQDKNPHSVETANGQAWLKAWHDGCQERQKVAQAEAVEAETEEAETSQDNEEQIDIEDAA